MSTLGSRQKSSSTITSPKERPEKTGRPAGETGCSAQPVTTVPAPSVSALAVTSDGRVTLSASTQQWLDAADQAFRQGMMTQDYALSQPFDLLQVARQSIEADIRGLIRLKQPASDEEIFATLNSMAEMFQVEVPDGVGLELYAAALRTLPRPAFVRARDVLVLHHKWPRLPYPADFVEAADETSRRIDILDMKLRFQRKAIISASKILRIRMI